MEVPVTSASVRVAVLIPSFNEEAGIGEVVKAFSRALPGAQIRVFDNNSSDRTRERAEQAGARLDQVLPQGKGHVVRRMFADVDADIYVLVDGDDTYDATTAPALIDDLIKHRADMAVAVREPVDLAAHRAGHALGNRLLTAILSRLFARPCRDILSGYRVFSRRFVKTFPIQSSGFEIETELTVHALSLQMNIVERPSPYRSRPSGSTSKLNTVGDGFRILGTMARLFMVERPLAFYGILALLLSLVSLVLATPVVLEWLETGLVPRFPTAILVTGMMVLAALCFFSGLILDTVSRGRREARILAYLQHPPPW